MSLKWQILKDLYIQHRCMLDTWVHLGVSTLQTKNHNHSSVLLVLPHVWSGSRAQQALGGGVIPSGFWRCCSDHEPSLATSLSISNQTQPGKEIPWATHNCLRYCVVDTLPLQRRCCGPGVALRHRSLLRMDVHGEWLPLPSRGQVAG